MMYVYETRDTRNEIQKEKRKRKVKKLMIVWAWEPGRISKAGWENHGLGVHVWAREPGRIGKNGRRNHGSGVRVT